MENKSKKRILISVLIGLVIINLATIGTMIYHKYNVRSFHKEFEKRKPQNRMDHERIKQFVKNELQLNDRQYNDYCKLKDLNTKNAGEMWEKLKYLREATLIEICLENPDSMRLIELSDSIGLFHKKIQLEMNRHFLAVKNTLNPEQVVKFNEMIKNVERGEWRRHGRETENGDSLMRPERKRNESN